MADKDKKSSNLLTYAHVGVEVILFVGLAIYIYKSNSATKAELDAIVKELNLLKLGGSPDVSNLTKTIKSQKDKIASLEATVADLQYTVQSLVDAQEPPVRQPRKLMGSSRMKRVEVQDDDEPAPRHKVFGKKKKPLPPPESEPELSDPDVSDALKGSDK